MKGLRVFDIVTSTFGLLLLSPLLVLIGVLIKLDSPGPVFYGALRVGQFGKLFTLYKFRSMYTGADELGPAITTADDKRITHVGKVLRGTKLDELPQLLNVFRGEMSLVGPRPEDPDYIKYYTLEQRQVLAMRPGITGMASLKYRNETAMLSGNDWERVYVNEILPEKLAIDLDYMSRRTFMSDLVLILKTVGGMFRSEGYS